MSDRIYTNQNKNIAFSFKSLSGVTVVTRIYIETQCLRYSDADKLVGSNCYCAIFEMGN